MSSVPLEILFEDNHLLVVNKSAPLATQGALPGEPSVVNWAREYLKRKYNKPGNVYIGVVSRLDSLVTGVLVLARTSKAAARLSEQFRAATTRKLYWAIVAGHPTPARQQLRDWLVKDDAQHRTRVASPHAPHAQEALLTYACLEHLPPDASWLEVELHTGRKHQIRVQLAEHGWPIWGDAKYGSRRTFPRGIALHARTLSIEHPTRREMLTFTASLPASWRGSGLPATAYSI